jgi:hypothetical protein
MLQQVEKILEFPQNTVAIQEIVFISYTVFSLYPIKRRQLEIWIRVVAFESPLLATADIQNRRCSL